MQHFKLFWFIIFNLVLVNGNVVSGQENLQIWQEFVATLKSGKLTVEHIRTYEFVSQESQLTHLLSLKKYSDENSSWEEWDITPEIF